MAPREAANASLLVEGVRKIHDRLHRVSPVNMILPRKRHSLQSWVVSQLFALLRWAQCPPNTTTSETELISISVPFSSGKRALLSTADAQKFLSPDISVPFAKIDFASAAGAAGVPPVPAVRSLVGGDWISTDEADVWLDRIGAAARLAQATGFPTRSAIYQTIAADPAEMLMQRVEGERGAVSITQADLIRKLPFFRTSSLYKEAQS